MASLVFVKRSPDSEEMTALALTSGSVLVLGDDGNMGSFEVGDEASLRKHLGKMTVDDIKGTCGALGFRLSAIRDGRAVRMTKGDHINAFVEHWGAIRERPQLRASTSLPSASTGAGGTVPFQGTGHHLADDKAAVRVDVIHHLDGKKVSLGDFTVKIELDKSVSSLVALTAEGIGGTFRDGYDFKQVLMFKAGYLKNMTASLQSLGFSLDDTNKVICHVYEEGDPRFRAIMMGSSDNTSSEDEEEDKTKKPSVFEKFGGVRAFRVVGFENGKPVMEELEEHEMSKDDDTASDISISDLLDLFDDGEPLVIDETYLNDPVDFMEEADKNPIALTIKEPKGGRVLLNINLTHRHFTFDQLKGMIAKVIAKKPTYDKKKGITKDNFNLLLGGEKPEGADELADFVDDRTPEADMTLMLLLKGGGKRMPSIKKTKKVKDLKLKLDEQKTSASGVVSTEMTTAKGIIELFVANAENNPIEAMKGFLSGNTMGNLNSIVEKLDETSTGTADGKIRGIAHFFFGDVFTKMDNEKTEREKVLLWAKSSLEWAFNAAGETETGLNLTKFRDLIEKAKIFKQGQLSSTADASATPAGATPMETEE
eukprot:s3887_g1.t1